MAYRKFLILGTALVAMLGLSTGCGTIQPEEEVQKPDKFASEETAVTVMVVDAATGENITDQEVQITITGDDAQNVVDGMGAPLTSATATAGAAMMYVRNAPADIRILASADGYIKSGKALTVETGDNQVTISLVEKANPPEGIQYEERQVNGGSSGEVSTPVVIETPEMQGTDAKVRVGISENTGLLDEEGEPVTGSIQTELAHFSNEDEEALLAFPGGFTTEVGSGDNVEEGIIATAGYFSLTMQNEDGRKVTDFSQPLSVTIDIPGTTVNAETGLPVAEGDVVRIFSYDEDLGKWEFENPAELSGPDEDGNYQTTIQVDHLCYWNVGWWVRNDEYARGVKFALEGGEGKAVRLVFSRASGGGWMKEVYSLGKDTVTVKRIPNGFDVEAVAYYLDEEVGSITILEGAATDDAVIDFPLTITANTSEVTAVVSEVCEQNTSLSTPLASSIVTVAKDGKFVTGAMTDEDGAAFLGDLVVGETYTIAARGRRGNTGAVETVVIGSDNMTIHLDIMIECKPVTGGSN